MPTIEDALRQAEAALRDGGIAEPRRDAVSLIGFALRKNKAYIYAHPEHRLTTDEATQFDTAIRRRVSHEPLQYITGVQEFYGLEFEVSPDVLIPRPETEILVEQAIRILDNRGRFCEIGTGSGCISIAILTESPDVHAIGLEISPGAIAVARRNAENLGVGGRFRILESDLFAALGDEQFELIVSNPPYVPADDLNGLQREVRDFEPHMALTDGGDGLSIIQRIVNESTTYLHDQGHLLIEIGFDQSNRVSAMFSQDIWELPVMLPDLQGIPRIVHARLKPRTSGTETA